jgi:hypothetical protein
MILKERNERMSKREKVRAPWLGWIVALLLLAGGAELKAQVGSSVAPVAVRGKIVSLTGPELVMVGTGGNVKVIVDEKTIIRGEVPIPFSDITPGVYLGTTATEQSDGTFLASEVHIFSEDQRGTGEGHRPLGSDPQSGATMTNANVERIEDVTVRNIKGRLMTLKFKGGEVKVLVPPEIPIVKRLLGDRTLLKPGSELALQATRASDGSLSASQITVRAARK